ncbi:hypothetical protein [Rhodococcus opacus]|uniref:ATP/GTP-binding protein n=2 Tax=Rhodococcus TaxID=1827 RepID=C1BE75_RHOOB|nr:hypothetical protein [Rhodococcus opacus]BAH56115.1 hypothetical protein ROP_pKNR-00230 [Rhodococcus opacus B4]
MFEIMTPEQRAKYQTRVYAGGIGGGWAKFKIRTDDNRRRNASARERTEQSTTAGGPKLSDRGHRGAGGGRAASVGKQPELRSTSVHAAGAFWPWSVGAGAPAVGPVIGSHLVTHAPVSFGLLNWFRRGFITAPVAFVLGLNGYGKSSFVRKVILGAMAQGVTALFLADKKPDYRKIVEEVAGTDAVVDVGYAFGHINPLAGGVLGSIIPRLAAFPDLQLRWLEELRGRQTETVSALIELRRGQAIEDWEESIVGSAIAILFDEKGFTPDEPPLLEDMLGLIIEGHPQLLEDAGVDTIEDYREAVRPLRRSLRAFVNPKSRFGRIFNGQTTHPLSLDHPAIGFDVSHIPNGDKKLRAAVMLVCWSDGFALIDAANALTDAGLAPQRFFEAVMDEIWDVLGLGPFMVDRIDALTRLNRQIATGLWMITHSMADLETAADGATTSRAVGFLERARVKIIGPIPEKEIDRLDGVVTFTDTEADMVTKWSSPPPMTGEQPREDQPAPPPPGTGNVLIKTGDDPRAPGIPVHVIFTRSEIESGVHNTNARYTDTAAREEDAA